MADARVTNPLVEQFLRGGIARELRLMAAQGLLPLAPADLVELWSELVRDPDAAVVDASRKSLASLPADEFLPVAKDRSTPAVVLEFVAANRSERELREAALQNPSMTDAAVQSLAADLPSELAELVVINQVRLLRCTPLLETLESNSRLTNDQRRRLHELRETFKIGAEPELPAPEPEPEPAPPAPEPAPEPEPEPIAEEISEDEAIVRYLSEDERKETEKVSAVQKLYRLNTAEKIITAIKGTREERALLIRDPNRLVSAAVLGSPQLTEAEIESISSMKNVSDDVLRKIGGHREWTKRYQVVSNLVRNPRCPIAISLGLVPRLNPREMKALAVDRNVPEAVRKHAQKFIRQPGR